MLLQDVYQALARMSGQATFVNGYFLFTCCNTEMAYLFCFS